MLTDATVSGTANNGAADTFRLVMSGASVQAYVNGTLNKTITLASLTATGKINVTGSNDADTLTVDSSAGLLTGFGGIVFTAGSGTDALILSGGSFASETCAAGTDTVKDASNNTQTVTFSSLESVQSTVTIATTLTVSFKPGSPDTLTLEPSGAGAGALSFDNATIPPVTFSNVTALNLAATAGQGSAFGVDGTAGNDSFVYTSGATADAGTLTGAMNQSDVPYTLVPITFSGMSQSSQLLFNSVGFSHAGGYDTFTYHATAGNDTIGVASSGFGTGITNTVNSALFANLEVDNFSSVVVDGGTGTNTFNVTGGFDAGTVSIQGNASSNSDVLNVTGTEDPDDIVVDLAVSEISGFGGTAGFSGIAQVNIDGGGGSFGGDTLTLYGTTGNDSISYTPTGSQSGQFQNIGSPSFAFSNVDSGFTLNGGDGNDILIVNGQSGVKDAITVTSTGAASGTVDYASGAARDITFASFENLTLNGQASDNDVFVAGSNFGQGQSELTINGATLQVNSDGTLSPTVHLNIGTTGTTLLGSGLTKAVQISRLAFLSSSEPVQSNMAVSAPPVVSASAASAASTIDTLAITPTLATSASEPIASVPVAISASAASATPPVSDELVHNITLPVKAHDAVLRHAKPEPTVSGLTWLWEQLKSGEQRLKKRATMTHAVDAALLKF